MPQNVKYIVSDGKNFYRSEPAYYGPDGPVEIKNRAKYMAGGSAPHWNRHSDNSKSAKKKGTSNSYNPPAKVMYMPDAHNGHVVMITQDQLFARTGITVGFD